MFRKFISVLLFFAIILAFTACQSGGTPAETTEGTETDAPSVQIGEHDIVVSPDGDDTGDGTAEHPLATIAAAKEKAKSAPDGTDVTVWFRGGRYQFDTAIVFDETDRDGVTYSAYGDEKPVFSFGTPITEWTEGEINGVAAWVADVKEGSNFYVLTSETEILPRARYPKEGYFTVKWFDNEDILSEESQQGQHTKSFIAYKEDLLDFYDIEQVDLISTPNWNVASQPLESVDLETGRVVMQSRTWNLPLKPEAEYYLENVREAVSEPGEWYLDHGENRVYYIPKDGEKMDSTVLYACGSPELMNFSGVDNVTFRGITFRDSDGDDWIGSYGGSCIGNSVALNINHTNNLSFDSCTFTCIGRTALGFKSDNHGGVINNCHFTQIGMCALLVRGDMLEPGDPAITSNFTVTNNLVEYYGRVCAAGDGISICYVDTADVSNNEVHDGYYDGIRSGYSEETPNPTRNISVKHNLVYNIGFFTLSDMGGIYVVGEQEGTVISENVIHDVKHSTSPHGYAGNGIYLDGHTSGVTVEKNLVYNCSSCAVVVHCDCSDIVIRGNITANSDAAFAYGENNSFEVCGNIFVTDGKDIYSADESDNSVVNDHGNFLFDYSGKPAEEYNLPDCVKEQTIADPLFTDPANGDYTLSKDSPAIAAGFETWDYSLAGKNNQKPMGDGLMDGERSVLGDSEQKKSVFVLDTDLGTDDACALLLLKNLPVKPDYVVASYGNTTLEGACRNAVLLKKYLGENYKIVSGVAAPENLSSEESDFHGVDGLAGLADSMAEKLNLTDEELHDVMPFSEFEKILMQADDITYVTVGTLTSLTHLIRNKELHFGRICVMGGGLSEFNCSHDTEFNFSKDADSVKTLLTSGLNVTLFPLDVTNHQRISAEEIDEFEKSGAYPEYIAFLRHNLKANTLYDNIPAAVLHDTLPVLYLSYPEQFELTDMRLISDEYGHIEQSDKGEILHVCSSVKNGFVGDMMAKAFSAS